MRILTDVKDIFALPRGPKDAICVTTNGCVHKDGRAVMGRGIARMADLKFGLAEQLAGYLKRYGNRLFYMGPKTDRHTGRTMSVITFPTKHDWRDGSDLDLIKTSARQLVTACDKFGIETCYLIYPGCANGRLDWETQVRPAIEPILTGDRFVIADTALN